MSEEQWSNERLDNMTQLELAHLYRFAAPGHVVFQLNSPLWAHFQKCFDGMTPAISKAIGW